MIFGLTFKNRHIYILLSLSGARYTYTIKRRKRESARQAALHEIYLYMEI